MTVVPGKDADFVILAENPLNVNPLHIEDIAVLGTIKKGKTIWKHAAAGKP